jgi:hypothetical protein
MVHWRADFASARSFPCVAAFMIAAAGEEAQRVRKLAQAVPSQMHRKPPVPQFGLSIELDRYTRFVFRAGREPTSAPRSSGSLSFLVANPEQVFSRKQIRGTWGGTYASCEIDHPNHSATAPVERLCPSASTRQAPPTRKPNIDVKPPAGLSHQQSPHNISTSRPACSTTYSQTHSFLVIGKFLMTAPRPLDVSNLAAQVLLQVLLVFRKDQLRRQSEGLVDTLYTFGCHQIRLRQVHCTSLRRTQTASHHH